jgi:hypothetical protein
MMSFALDWVIHLVWSLLEVVSIVGGLEDPFQVLQMLEMR